MPQTFGPIQIGPLLLRLGMQTPKRIANVAFRAYRAKGLIMPEEILLPTDAEVYISEVEYEELRPVADRIASAVARLAQHAVQPDPHTRSESRLKLLTDPPRIVVKGDPELRPGLVALNAWFDSANQAAAEAFAQPAPRKTDSAEALVADKRTESIAFRLELTVDGEQRTYPLYRETTLGRVATADIRIDDPKVSREHARIELAEDILTITDLDSADGTRVNGRDVAGPVGLNPGDRIEIGRNCLARVARAGDAT